MIRIKKSKLGNKITPKQEFTTIQTNEKVVLLIPKEKTKKYINNKEMVYKW